MFIVFLIEFTKKIGKAEQNKTKQKPNEKPENKKNTILTVRGKH